MKKLAFIGNSEPPAKLLELFRKMTPGQSGIWGQLQGVDNYEEADYFAVIDYLPNHLIGKIDESKCVFLGAHPETMSAYRNMDCYNGLRMYDCKKEFGFGEYWIKYDYDYLTALQPIQKTKQLGCIMSDARTQSYHRARLEWLERYTNQANIGEFDLHGRIVPFTDNMKKYYKGACGSYDPRGAAASGGNNHMIGKEEVYESHKFMVEFDAPGANYFSERVFDCLLLWAVPIYWGGRLRGHLPHQSFIELDINGNGQELARVDDYDMRVKYIAEARDLLLNQYQIWPRVHHAIFNTCR